MNEKGIILLVSLFITLILTILGMGLLFLSQVHYKASAYHKFYLSSQYASECGIKKDYIGLYNFIINYSSPPGLTAEQIDNYKQDAHQNGVKIIEHILNKPLPLIEEESWKKLKWRTESSFSLRNIRENKSFFQSEYEFKIDSKGGIENSYFSSQSILKGTLSLFAGRVPLFLFPLLVEKKSENETVEEFLKRNKIEFVSSDKRLSPKKTYFPGTEIIPEEANAQLLKALKIEYFYPQNLSYLELRRALGLEEINEPIPSGVYLIKDDLGLGGIYVEGDLEKMILAIDESYQVVGFFMEKGTWVIKFSLEESKTVFFSPTECVYYDLIPLGIIIVNGKIKSLGGGIVNSDGMPVLVDDQEIPSILKGLNLTIISSDKIDISSHLILQGVKWEEGIPYVKDSDTQLNLFSTGKDFFDDSEKEGGISIAEDSPNEIKIQACLVTKGQGFELKGEDKNVQVFGSIQASSLNSNDNNLEIALDNRLLRGENSFSNYPLSIIPLILISSFEISSWQEIQ
ncbi:MAG: hypothetical protein ACE5WD_12150 [Candidatus Aminicenantia bacterium]